MTTYPLIFFSHAFILISASRGGGGEDEFRFGNKVINSLMSKKTEAMQFKAVGNLVLINISAVFVLKQAACFAL
jgi:hypothetical protein